jgi:hypothetical protein
MNLKVRLQLAAIFVLPILAAACNGADDAVGGSTSEVPQQAVTEAAQQVPMALLAADVLTRSVALTSSGQCSSGVDLGGGLSIDCAPLDGGVSFWVTGSPTSAPACLFEIGIDAYPGDDGAYAFIVPPLDSYVSCNNLETYLSATGNVTADPSGSVQAASATMSFANRTWQWNTQTLTLSDPGLGVSMTVALGTGSGSVTHLGRTAATIAVTGGCATVNFLDATLTDSTVCAW